MKGAISIGAGVTIPIAVVSTAIAAQGDSTTQGVALSSQALVIVALLVCALAAAIVALFWLLQTAHDKETAARKEACDKEVAGYNEQIILLRSQCTSLSDKLDVALDFERVQRTAEIAETRQLMRNVETALVNNTDSLEIMSAAIRQSTIEASSEHNKLMAGLTIMLSQVKQVTT